MAKKKDDGTKMIAENRKARFSYAIGDTLEAGIMLTGSEVKSLRGGHSTIAESYAHAKDGELWLVNSYIPEYLQANRMNHAPKRTRKSNLAPATKPRAKAKKLYLEGEIEPYRLAA